MVYNNKSIQYHFNSAFLLPLKNLFSVRWFELKKTELEILYIDWQNFKITFCLYK